MSFHLKYRPNNFDDVIGNITSVRKLKSLLSQKDHPHVFLFQGPSGCGKTTLARIIGKELNCSDRSFIEMNIADTGGVDVAREIISKMGLMPLDNSPVKIYLLDEIQRSTVPFQQALLKALEDTPKHVYFILCTTNPEKLLTTIKTRCSKFDVSLLSERQTISLLRRITEKEGNKQVAKSSNGSPRQALVILEQIINLPPEDRKKAIIEIERREKQAIDLCRILNGGENWREVTAVLRDIKKDNDYIETIRRTVLSYFDSVLIKNNKIDNKAWLIIDCFKNNFFDMGKAGLSWACAQVFMED